MNATALIAEDEPLLAASLTMELARLWPELTLVATVGDGHSAVRQALQRQPDILFLDIRMPGMTGLDAAQALAEDWPDGGRTFPLIVFVTAYDQYALPAFERAAFDYVLKPVDPRRLAVTCDRLRSALAQRAPADPAAMQAVIDRLHRLAGEGGPTAPTAAASPLRVIQASVRNAVHMVPVDDVLYFEAADKYVRVVTLNAEYLIRVSLKELQPRLDAQRFWQIHRGTVVRCDAIDRAVHDESGKVAVVLRGRPETLNVSRLYSHLFKAM